MHELTSLEIGLLVREFKRLEGSRIRKFYDLGNGAFKIALYKSPDTRLVYVKLMKAINITEFSEAAGEATQFAMAMRKRIENSVVDSIQQMNNDRIIRFVLDKGRQFLVLEMYGKGNLILTGDLNSLIEVPVGDSLGNLGQLPQRANDLPGEQDPENQGCSNRGDRCDE